MIKLYTVNTLLTTENRGIAHPLIFDLHYFEKANQGTLDRYQLVADPSLADAFIFPIDVLSQSFSAVKKHYNRLLTLAKSQNKKLWIYTGGDYGITNHDLSLVTWKHAGTKSRNSEQTIIVPSMINDPVHHKRIVLHSSPYDSIPKVGFAGFATNSIKEKLRSILSTSLNNTARLASIDQSDHQHFFNAAAKRYKALHELKASSLINTDFILRSKYRAGARNEAERNKSTQEFFQNLMASPYTFCMRGAGNFSVRFYESLACGRIPILLDTDSHLPFEDMIHWNNHICRIDTSKDLVDQICRFHNKFNSVTFEQLQLANRALYENYFIRHEFFDKIYDRLERML